MNPNTEIDITHDRTFEVIRSAVNQMVDFIRPTYGPASNKVVISKPTHFMVVDDGVQIARDFELPDPTENAVVKIVRETAVATNDKVGDGTTGALIMLQAIINEVSRRRKIDGRAIELELKRGLEDLKRSLLRAARKIESRDDLKKVARISFDNDTIAGMIADLYHKVGTDSVITIERSPTADTTAEIAEGTKLETGYISPYMVTNPQRMDASFENPYILITDYRITEATDLLPIMEMMRELKKSNLVIIAENVEQNALATLVVNLPQVINPETHKPGVFPSIAVTAPKGSDRRILLEDLALLTGAKMFTSAKGDKLESCTMADLGRAARFIARREESVVVKPKGDKKAIEAAAHDLRKAIENEKVEARRKELQKRLGFFTNSVAVIKVGAPTENEQKALKYKVEDAVHSVRAAITDGVVCGAGLSLARLKTSSPILNEALKYPAKQLRENMGLDTELDLGASEAVNVVTGERGDFMEVGVIDPVNVLLAGAESAVSIASLLLTSSGTFVQYAPKPKNT